MKIELPINPAEIPTAQQKGVRLIRGVHMFYKKPALAKFEKTLARVLAPHYAKLRIADNSGAQVRIIYYFGYPSGTPKKNRVDMTPMTQRPDGDNLSKAIIDVLGDEYSIDKKTKKRVRVRKGFFADDSQVSILEIFKFRTTLMPRITIIINDVFEYLGLTPTKPLTNP